MTTPRDDLTYPGTHWAVTAPESLGLDGSALRDGCMPLPGAMMVCVGGRVVHEQGAVHQPAAMYSVSKALAGLVAARLVREGRLDLDEIVPGSEVPFGPGATYRQFLNMTSDFGLVPHEPGRHYAYNNQATHHVGQAMARAHFDEAAPDEVLRRAITDRIGAQDAVTFEGMWGGWHGGFRMSCRDLARVGLLVLRRGRWNGQTQLPADLIDSLYDDQIPEDATLNLSTGTDAHGGQDTWWNQVAVSKRIARGYALGWWPNVRGRWPALPRMTVAAVGKHGAKLMVCPERELVVAVAAREDAPPDVDAYLQPVLRAFEKK